MDQFVVFNSNEEKLAVDISHIERIIEFENPKQIPESSEHLLGVIQYNDMVIPIIDLTLKLYGKDSKKDIDSKIIIVSWKNKLIGLLVDRIIGIKDFSDNQYEKNTENLNMMKKYVKGFIKENGEDITIVLDVEKIFNIEQEKEILDASEGEENEKNNSDDE